MPKNSVINRTPQQATRELLDVSVTERTAFRTCRRRWLYETIENLEPKQREAWHLEFGTGIHTALEAYYKEAMGPMGSLNAALDAFEEWFVEASEPLEGEEYTALYDLRELGRIMLRNYPQYEATAPVQLGKPYAIEGEWIDGHEFHAARPKGYPESAEVVRHESGRLLVPIVDPETREPIAGSHGETAHLSARIDMLTERKTPKKGLWIVDHKTAAQAPNDRGLDFDDQVTGYCYVVWRWTGMIPRGVVYNVLIKCEPKEPRILKDGKLSTAKDQLTTPDLYREALQDHKLIMPGGTIVTEQHAACLEALLARGWDPFFRRFEVTRNEQQMLNFERRLLQEHDDMTDAIDDGKLYPNPSTFHCPMCSVKNICLAHEDGSDVGDVIEHQYRVAPDRKARR